MSAGDKTSLKKTNLKDLSHSNPDKNKKTKVNSGLRRKIVVGKIEMKKLDDKKEKEDLVLMNVEKELWESGDWRENIKDLNSSFSKLPPIIKENRVKHGKSQALGLIERFTINTYYMEL